MSVDMFIRIGDIKGESTDAKHKQQIDVMSWTWGVTNPGSPASGGGGGAGKVTVHDLSFTKRVDAATPPLVLACCEGKHFPEAVLAVRKAGQAALEFFTITLKDVLVGSVVMNGSEADVLLESVTLSFRQFKIAYTPQDKAGKAVAPITAGWDLVVNKKV